MDFSQRMGLKPVARAFQIESMDEELKIALWNAVTVYFWDKYERPYNGAYISGSNFDSFVKIYAISHDIAIDQLPNYWSEFLAMLRKIFFTSEWHRTYTFVEYMAANGPVTSTSRDSRAEFIKVSNSILERANSAYRFVQGKLAPITSVEEIEEIEQAISSATPYSGVKGHLNNALGFLTDKVRPDYSNSVKESISAVESLARHLTNDPKATLGPALAVLEKKHRLEPALKSAFSKLYGYTSDADGIRHSSMEDQPSVSKADARFMLICCSAFINYAIDRFED